MNNQPPTKLTTEPPRYRTLYAVYETRLDGTMINVKPAKPVRFVTTSQVFPSQEEAERFAASHRSATRIEHHEYEDCIVAVYENAWSRYIIFEMVEMIKEHTEEREAVIKALAERNSVANTLKELEDYTCVSQAQVYAKMIRIAEVKISLRQKDNALAEALNVLYKNGGKP